MQLLQTPETSILEPLDFITAQSSLSPLFVFAHTTHECNTNATRPRVYAMSSLVHKHPPNTQQHVNSSSAIIRYLGLYEDPFSKRPLKASAAKVCAFAIGATLSSDGQHVIVVYAIGSSLKLCSISVRHLLGVANVSTKMMCLVFFVCVLSCCFVVLCSLVGVSVFGVLWFV